MSGFHDALVIPRRPGFIFHQFQRELSDRTRVLNCETSAVLSYQRLKPPELAAPDSFNVAVPARIPRVGRIAERNRSDLQEIRLGPAGKFDSVAGVCRLTKNDSSAIDPGRRHSLRNIVAKGGQAIKHGSPALLRRHRLNLSFNEKVRALEEFGLAALQPPERLFANSDRRDAASGAFISESSAWRARRSPRRRACSRPFLTAAARSRSRLSATSDRRAAGSGAAAAPLPPNAV